MMDDAAMRTWHIIGGTAKLYDAIAMMFRYACPLALTGYQVDLAAVTPHDRGAGLYAAVRCGVAAAQAWWCVKQERGAFLASPVGLLS